MNYKDNYDNNHIQSVASENYDLSHFMMMCINKGIEFNPSYKDSTNENGFPYISFKFNEKNLELIYAIVALLRLEGYEFSFEKLSEKESAFNIVDIINSKGDTKLFKKLNDIITNYDLSKNYYYDLPGDLQKYFDICSFAHSDKKAATNNSEDNLKFKYIKQEDGHKYTIKTNDERYIQAADLSDFKLSSDDATLYEFISDDNNELSNILGSLNSNLEEVEKTSPNDENNQADKVLDDEEFDDEELEDAQEKEDEISTEEKAQDQPKDEMSLTNPLVDEEFEDAQEKENEISTEEKTQEQPKDEISLTNPLVDEENPELDESTLILNDDKFIDRLNTPDIVKIGEEEVTPQIDIGEISKMIYEEDSVLEEDIMVR